MDLATNKILFSCIFTTAIAFHHPLPQARPFVRSSTPSLSILPPARKVLEGGAELYTPLVGAAAAAFAARPVASLGTAFGFGCIFGIAASPALIRVFARYATAEDVPAARFRANDTLTAKVVKIVDGDTFRVAHLPPLWRLRATSRTHPQAAPS